MSEVHSAKGGRLITNDDKKRGRGIKKNLNRNKRADLLASRTLAIRTLTMVKGDIMRTSMNFC